VQPLRFAVFTDHREVRIAFVVTTFCFASSAVAAKREMKYRQAYGAPCVVVLQYAQAALTKLAYYKIYLLARSISE
jgi:hypothetical protein